MGGGGEKVQQTAELASVNVGSQVLLGTDREAGG